ncbi:MAG: class I SAM-dependent methyltransferase [Desulfobacteraceae bacterium]|nr:MAG: class I SAM-dependent methyltransferase [Desulfobacteraceae bacterium]
MNPEIQEVSMRYQRRKKSFNDRYSLLNFAHLKEEQEKELAIVRWIRSFGVSPLPMRRVLEIGCGTGSNLLQLLRLGFRPENLVGSELLTDRLEECRRLLPSSIRLIPGDATEIDIPDGSFDIVFQSTVFTSILDKDFQFRLARSMWRLIKPGGGVLWYDFIYDNPKNPDVRGIELKQVKTLFPDGRMKYWRLTLAPPISRRVTRVHPFLYHVFNMFPFLRTHVLCWIQKIA